MDKSTNSFANSDNYCHSSESLSGRESEMNDNFVDNSVVDSNSDNFMDVLEDFRENWKKELQNNKNLNNFDNNLLDSDQMLSEIDWKAMELFKEGVLLERRGKLYEAVAFYRRATQLVPDIEFKMYRLETRMQAREETDDNSGIESNSNESNIDSTQTYEDFDDNDCDLITRFLRLNSDEFGNVFICSAKQSTSRTHFSALPFEVVLIILKWIVSNELDLRSLEMFGSVCRGFYIASRDSELWRLSCQNTWGSSSSSMISNYGNNWRHMFVERVRPNFNGTYISRTTYIRQGESSFQDVHYRPCYLVEYYRYIRFFPNGHVLMLTTADDPHQSLPLLRHRKPKNSNVLSGHYRINGQIISIVLKREFVSESSQLSRKYKSKGREKGLSTQTFNISVEVKAVKNRRNHSLIWKHYSVQHKKPNGQESSTAFELTSNRFPAFLFSRVKSYVSEAEYKLI